MALTTKTITGGWHLPDGSLAHDGQMIVTIATSNGTLNDTVGHAVLSGSMKYDVQADGNIATATLPTLPQTGLSPAGAMYHAVFHSFINGVADISLGNFTLTANTTWDALNFVIDGDLTPSAVTQVIADAAQVATDRAAVEAIGTTTDGVVASKVALADSATDIALKNRYADKASPFFARFGPGLMGGDDFNVADVANLSQFTEGYHLKSGHSLTSDGAVSSASIAAISGKRLRWTDGTPGGTPIRIVGTLLNREPTRIGAAPIFSAETTTGTWSSVPFGGNGVIGACQTSFALGSVQLALFKRGVMLFVVPNPIVGPYPTLYQYEFPTPLADDDVTSYPFYMDFDRPTSSVTIHVPGKMDPVTVTDAQFATYWGPRVCFQERRSASTDARVSFDAVGFGAATTAGESGVPTALSLPYTPGNYLTTTPPAGYTVTDPQADFWGAPVGGWNNSATFNRNNVAAALWNTAADHRAFTALVLGATGKPAAYLSRDGVESVLNACSTALPAGALGVRVKYEHASGNVRYYYTLDPATATGPTWTELGTAGGTNSFTAGTTLYNPPRRTKLQVGTRDNSSTLMFGGLLSRVVWSDTTGTLADCDLRTLWLASRKTDPQGNTWHLQGTAWSWQLPTDAVTGLTARLAAVEALAAAAHPERWIIDIDPLGGAHANTNWSANQQSNGYLFGGYRQASASGAIGNSVAWDTWLDAGTYDIETIFRGFTTYGIVQWSIDGTNVGASFDQYLAAATADQRNTQTGITVAVAGKKRVALTVTGKNASATAYGASVQHVQIRRTA